MTRTWDIPEKFNIGSACTDAHLDTPRERQLAMIVEDASGALARATYGELAAFTGKFSQLLRRLGVPPQARVLIRLPNCLEYPVAFLGTLKAGCIAVPTSTLLTAEEVSYLARDSDARVLVTHKRMWRELSKGFFEGYRIETVILVGEGDPPRAEDAGVEVIELDEALPKIDSWDPPCDTRANDPAYLVYTSGTTGYPKGVLHAHRALIGRLPASKYWFDFAGADRILHSGKFNWTYVLGTGMMDPFYHGKTVIVYEGPADADVWPQLIARHGCTIFVGVPTVYRQILQKTDATKEDVPSLRHCMCAGEHLSDEVLTAWRERFGQEIYEAIGMSECSYYISQPRGVPVRPGSAGLVQPGHEIKLLDESLREVPPGVEGGIAVAEDDPGLFLEYWRLPAETAASRRGGWFLTGDYARRDEDGYVWFIGRRDDIINSFGYRVSPYEVERVLKGHPAVADCAVVGEELSADKVLVSACVIAAPGTAPTEAELLAYGREHLARYKAPRRVRFLAEFPRTRNGKILRKRLAEMLKEKGQAS